MPTPLARTFSTIDSIKRILGDAISNPRQFVASAGENVAPLSMEAAMEAVTSFAPAGMIVPATRTLSFTAFNQAKKALASGTTPAPEVFKTMGAYASPNDSVLRSVISDLGAKLRSPQTAHKTPLPAGVTLGDVIDHPELFAKLPELAYIPVSTPRGQFNGASYYPATPGSLPAIEMGHATTPDTYLTNLLHEMQHGVQDVGGMAKGGSPEAFLASPARLERGVRLATKPLEQAERQLGLAAMQKDINPYTNQRAIQKLPEYAAVKAARADLLTLQRTKQAAVDSYYGIPGEVEARLTEAMFKAGKGADTFPPSFQATIKDLMRPAPAPDIKHDLEPAVQAVINKLSAAP